MPHIFRFVGWVWVGLAPLPALAQQGPGSNGYPMLWHQGTMFGPIMLLMVAAVVAQGVMAFRSAGRGACHAWEPQGHRRMGDAMDILEQRFARGDIDQAEFEAKRTLLSH
jgi:putative membrane protein